jgi:hypothetical protein
MTDGRTDGREVELPEPLQKVARAYHQPPAVPRDEIWHRIQAARRSGNPADPTIRPSDRLSVRPTVRPSVWWLGLAALLAIGVAIGRWTAVATGPAPVQVEATVTNAKPRGGAAYAVATSEHLSRTETFLTSLRVGDRTPLLEGQARDLLLTTRLLLDARGVTDPRTRVLLEDLELILVQITQLGDRNGEELDLITDGLEQRQVLPRLRSALPLAL